MLAGPAMPETAMKAADIPPIEREVLNLDKALSETADALSFVYERLARLEGRLTTVLGPQRPTEGPGGERDLVPAARAQSPLAGALEERVAQLTRLAAGVRDAARQLEDLTVRVEL